MIPLQFEYIERCTYIEYKNFVTILGEHKHRYTGKNFFRIREEYDHGGIQEYMVSEETMKQMLSKRVEE